MDETEACSKVNEITKDDGSEANSAYSEETDDENISDGEYMTSNTNSEVFSYKVTKVSDENTSSVKKKGTFKLSVTRKEGPTQEQLFKYSCGTCGKFCTNSSKLKDHERIHTNEKPHACLCCSKTFRLKASLARHVRTHTGMLLSEHLKTGMT